MPLPSKEQAQKFFSELETSSRTARLVAAGSAEVSPWGDAGAWGPPTGIVLHYTAGGSFRGSVDWLCRPSYEAKASAHVVIGRGREAWADYDISEGGLVDQLPASVVQLRAPSQQCWHSTWANRDYIGIELACVGEVRKDGRGVFVGPNNNWSEKISDTPSIYSAGGKYWQNYTMPQIATAVAVSQYYRALFAGITRENIIGHEHAQGERTIDRIGCRKQDAGIAFGYFAFRECVLGLQDVSAFSLRPRAPDEAGTTLETMIGSLENAQHLTAPQLDKVASDAMISLGYDISAPKKGTQYFDGQMPSNSRSLYIAQRMLGLVADSKLGPKTAAALAWRLKDRWSA